MIQRNKHVILIALACAFLGFILARQFFWHKQVRSLTESDQEKELSLQVSQLFKSNKELVIEKGRLEKRYSDLHKAAIDEKTAQEALEESINQNEIIIGSVAVKGQGISINFTDPLTATQITDLINALRNMGAEAISINGRRISYTNGWDGKTFNAPYTIQAIGKSNLLKESLERRGGIMEQIGFAGTVRVEKELRIAAVRQ
jgi:uncharacterized protein YlxW (UPF0749 family)